MTIGDLSQREEVFSIRLPRLLCLLAYNSLDCEIQGIDDLQAAYEQQYGPGDYIPPVAVVYWSFRIMVGLGFLMIGLSLWGLFLVMGEILLERPKVLKIYQWSLFLPFLANTAGWIMTEIGRMPWMVTATISGSFEGQAATTDPIINTSDPNHSHQTSGL